MLSSIDKEILKNKKKFDGYLNSLLSKQLTKTYLNKAILYSVLNGGKRIRPFLLKQFAEIKKIKPSIYYRLSTVVELIHSYSLIHDDLPSMDDDDFRRGKLSTHKKFGEAQAILAGDSLHDLAFEILSDEKTNSSPKIRIRLVNLLSSCIGSNGLAGGQSLDLLYE